MNTLLPDEDYVYSALLRCNYFPMVKKYLDEIPPVFSTEKFTPRIADVLIKAVTQRRGGYDQIEFGATRFSHVKRLMHIPHPLPYARLCKHISENWDELKHICGNDESQIKPAVHEDDRLVILGEYEQLEAGRLVVMDKTKFPETVIQELSLSTGKLYRVNADISTCFPSIYTHSIPWALVGHDSAKANRNQNTWYNELDRLQRSIKRNETQGIPIGPATSNVISELVLFKIDEVLRAKDYQFIRFIDDYKYFSPTQEKAEEFLLDLEQELRKYLLNINVKKVEIEELPVPLRSAWVTELASRLPIDEQSAPRIISDFLDYSINLQRLHPEGSVLKYAARSLVRIIDDDNAEIYLRYLVSLAFHHPILLPILCEVVKNHKGIIDEPEFRPVIERQIKFKRSDAICWGLFFMGMSGYQIDDALATSVIETRDCMSMAMLLAISQHQEKVIEFLMTLATATNYDRDQYWILIHELADKVGVHLKYINETGLSLLRDNGVSFIRPLSDFVE